MNICYFSVLLHILNKHFFSLLLFVSLYLLYYCNYYLVIDTNDCSSKNSLVRTFFLSQETIKFILPKFF